MASPVPFHISRNASVVTGGFLGEHNLAASNLTYVNNEEFMRFTMADRMLARALGLDVHLRSPWANNSFIDDISSMRNEVVDDAILEHERATDPHADTVSDTVVEHRPSRFQAANVPQIVEVKWSAFTSNAGDRWPETAVRVLSTPRRDGVLTIEFSERVLE